MITDSSRPAALLLAFLLALAAPLAVAASPTAEESQLCARRDRHDPESARPGSPLRVREECRDDEVAVEAPLALCAPLEERGGDELKEGARARVAASCRESRQAQLAELVHDDGGVFADPPPATVKPIIFDLASGVATVTGPYPGGFGACGQTGEWIKEHYPGFGMAAVPAAFFSEYVPATGNVQCDTSLGVATDLQGEPLCFELTGLSGAVTVKVVVADKCAGDCSANVAQCETAQPNASCASSAGTASCLDCPDPSIQFEQQWRCPPAMDCFRAHNPGENWKDWDNSFLSSTLGINVGTECEISGYMPSGDFPAHVDWCSGENAHFDLQDGNPFDASNNPTVVNYARIQCPTPTP